MKSAHPLDIHQLVLSIYHLLRKYNNLFNNFWKLISYKKVQAFEADVNFIKKKSIVLPKVLLVNSEPTT